MGTGRETLWIGGSQTLSFETIQSVMFARKRRAFGPTGANAPRTDRLDLCRKTPSSTSR
jgi:hypothetical protein